MRRTMKEEKPTQEKAPAAGKRRPGGAQPGAGRPAFVPTKTERELVATLSGYGLPQDQIAILVRDGIDLSTLRKHFERELLLGKASANSKVGKTLFTKAVEGDTASAIWWSKTQLRWAETHRIQHAGADDGPLRVEVNVFDEILKNIELKRRQPDEGGGSGRG